MEPLISIATFKSLISDSRLMELGFFIATTVIMLIFNINWRHYVRYWLGPRPPYSSSKLMLARGFFLICFVSSAIKLVSEIINLHPALKSLGVALFDASLIMGIFFALDAVLRFAMGPPTKFD